MSSERSQTGVVTLPCVEEVGKHPPVLGSTVLGNLSQLEEFGQTSLSVTPPEFGWDCLLETKSTMLDLDSRFEPFSLRLPRFIVPEDQCLQSDRDDRSRTNTYY